MIDIDKIAALRATIRNLQRDIEQLMAENDRLHGVISEAVENMGKAIE